MKILLIDDHRLVADAMAVMLGDLGEDVQVTTCHTTHRALSLIDEGYTYDLILTDLLMPGIDGLGLLHGLNSRKITTPAVEISSVDKKQDIQKALDQGAAGFIQKTTPKGVMLSALQRVLSGKLYYPDGMQIDSGGTAGDHDTQLSADAPVLNERQHEVLELMAAGNSNKQIAQLIGIKEPTVKYHTSQLFKLLGVKNRTSCIREGYRLNLIRHSNSSVG